MSDKKTERNKKICDYYRNHKTTYAKIARMFKISTARVGMIINTERQGGDSIERPYES